jgi:hypothetical protein
MRNNHTPIIFKVVSVRDGNGKPTAKRGKCNGARTCNGQPDPD